MTTYSLVNPRFSVPRKYPDDLNAALAAGYCDNGGCGYYRIIFPMQALGQKYEQMRLDTHFGVSLPQPGTRSYRMQRLFGQPLRDFFRNTALPHFRRYGIRFIYDIDDILDLDAIPEYNCVRECFRGAMDTLPFFLEAADLITVSTPQLRDFYVRRLGLPPEKFRVFPNYMPRFWADRYRECVVTDRRRRHRGQRPRIGIPGSPTHFDLTGDRTDDCTALNEWIIANRRKYQFVFQNRISRALRPYAEDFELYPCVPFLSYLRQQQELDLDLLIHPLLDHEFNRCKSIIKLLEAWGMGTPILVQDLPNYRNASPECCFHDVAEMTAKCDAILGDDDRYLAECTRNYRTLQGYFLEFHLTELLNLLLFA